jgi:PAS domain S-box-containing protein
MNQTILSQTQDYLDIAGVIIVVINKDQTVELINKMGCELLGYRKNEIEGKNWFDNFIPENERAGLKKEFCQFLKGESRASAVRENNILTKSNDTRMIRWRNAILRNEAGEVAATLSSGEDVTEKKILLATLAKQERNKRKQVIQSAIEAQENERKDIALELHDNVGQILTTSKLWMEQELLENKKPYILKSYDLLQKAINEIRNLSHRIDPVHLNELGLEHSIKELVSHIHSSRGLAVTLTIKGKELLQKTDPSICLSLFRITQEQLNNVIKHADASNVLINIEASPGSIDLEIKDNGRGFNLKRAMKGSGIRNMYTRTEFHMGKTHINTAPGEGCTLSVYIPIVK